MKTFEDYLKEVHFTDNPTVLDDDLPDSYSDWLMEIESDDWIRYAEEWNDIFVADIRLSVEKLGKILSND